MINDPSQPNDPAVFADTDATATATLDGASGSAAVAGAPPPPPVLPGGVSANGGTPNQPHIDIADEMRNSYLGYAMSTIVSRALPDVRDGLKPVQRRILYAMRELGLSPNSRHLKSAKVVGECMGNYHPHGDQALYGTMVRMAQPFSLRYPLIDGQGNFGCFTGDTRIKLLDGTEKSFEELAALGSDARFDVYSVDKQGRIVVGEGRNARVTRKNAELAEVTLDSGARIRCTPDHRFLLRDGVTYKQAQDLTSDDSLMPGYFDEAPVKPGLNPYLRVLQPATGEYEFVHHLGDRFNAERGTARPVAGNAYVRHHKNFDRRDNRPANIERMGFLEHLHLHAEHLGVLWQDPAFRAAQRDGVERYYAEHPEARNERRERIVRQNRDELFRAQNGARVAASLKQRYADDPDARAELSRRMKALWANPDYREKISAALSGLEKRPLTPEQKARVAQIVGEKSRAMWSDETKRGEIVAAITAAMAFPDLRARLSENAKALWQDPAFRAKYPDGHFARMARALWDDPATREKHREKIAGQWATPDFRTAQREGVRGSNARRLAANPQMMADLAASASVALKQKWTEPDHKRQVMRQRVARHSSRLVAEFGRENVTPDLYESRRDANWIPRLGTALTYFENWDELLSAAQTYNHRVVSVRPLDKSADVYDITVDEHHNFLLADGVFVHNSVDDDPPAAMRYTEARLTPLAMEMMEDIEKDTVDFVPTYDNERREPSILPGKFPNLVCNGGSGIAVGMATNLPPHNLREVADALAHLLDKPEASTEELMRFIPGPDFPTAGLILGTKGIRSAYETGRGSVTMQAKTSIEPMDNGKNAIVVTELPYQVIKSKLIEQIAALVKEKKVEGITAVDDFSDKTGMRMVVELRRDVMPQKVLNYLLKHTPLRLNFGVILLSLVDNGRGPRTMGLKGLLAEYLTHRRIIITRRTRFELNRAKARAHILEGLQIAVQFLDEVIALIRASNTTEVARTRLIERFAFSGIQADNILSMQLRQLTGLEQEKIENEYKELLKEIARLEDILSDPARVRAIIKADLKYLKDKFGDERRTRIVPQEAEEINIEDLIADEEMLITITKDGYIKRMEMDTFPSQRRGGKGRIAGRTKNEDTFEHFFRASTHDYLLFFTDRGRVYRLKAFEVPQTSRQAMGTAIVNLIQIQPDERITATVPIHDLRAATGFLLMATERGEVKRTKIEEYANLRANGLVTFNLEPDDRLSWVRHTQGDSRIVMTTTKGMAIQFPEDGIRASGRASGGVRGILLDGPDDRVVAVDTVTDPASDLLVVSERGMGKRTPMSAYRSQSRGGKGLRTMNLTDKTGSLVASCVIGRENQNNLRLVIVTAQGIGIRMVVSEVKTTDGRSTQGVKLINLADGDHVRTVEYMDVSKNEEAE